MKTREQGFTLIELLVAVAVIALLVGIAIVNLHKAHLNSRETVVAGEVQTVGQAQVQYLSQYGRFAASLTELGPPSAGTAGPQAAELIPASLASGEKNGYRFTLALTPSGYSVNANPKVFGADGRRTFYLDQNGTLHQNWGQEPASAESPEFQ